MLTIWSTAISNIFVKCKILYQCTFNLDFKDYYIQVLCLNNKHIELTLGKVANLSKPSMKQNS